MIPVAFGVGVFAGFGIIGFTDDRRKRLLVTYAAVAIALGIGIVAGASGDEDRNVLASIGLSLLDAAAGAVLGAIVGWFVAP